MELVVTSPFPPSVNMYLGKRVVGSGKRAYVQVYETIKAKAYKREFKKILREESYKQKQETINQLKEGFFRTLNKI